MTSLTINAAVAANHTKAQAFLQTFFKYLPYALIAMLAVIGLMEAAHAVGTLDATAKGQALKAAYTAVDDLTGGYGKALVLSIGFIVTVFGILASQATGPVLKYIGIAIYASMALGAAFALGGALI